MIIEIFSNEAKNFFELANSPRMDCKFLNNISTIENVYIIKSSLAKGMIFFF
jgi:hypothetical protein